MLSNTPAAGNHKATPQNRSERDFNLCHRTDEQRQIIAIDTEICFWLWLRQAGKVLHTDIVNVLRKMDKPLAALYRERLNHWRDEFRPSVQNVARFAAIDEKTWAKCIAQFKQQTARFNG